MESYAGLAGYSNDDGNSSTSSIIEDEDSASTSKKAPSKKGNSSSSGKYDERVRFSLPDGYEFVDEKDYNGDRSVKINVNLSKNKDSETEY